MSVTIKICGITSPEDGEAAAEAGANAIGLMFYEKSSRAISLERAEAIVQSLPPYVAKVGVFVNPTSDLVWAAMARAQLDILQFHGDETSEFCTGFGMMNMKAFRMKNEESLLELSKYSTDAFLLDSYVPGEAGGTGAIFNWDLAIKASKLGKPVFLAGGLTPANVSEAVRIVRPYGVDVSSGVESAPGKKDASRMRDFVAAVLSV